MFCDKAAPHIPISLFSPTRIQNCSTQNVIIEYSRRHISRAAYNLEIPLDSTFFILRFFASVFEFNKTIIYSYFHRLSVYIILFVGKYFCFLIFFLGSHSIFYDHGGGELGFNDL